MKSLQEKQQTQGMTQKRRQEKGKKDERDEKMKEKKESALIPLRHSQIAGANR